MAQHGTGREKARDLVENVSAVLDGLQRRNGYPLAGEISALIETLEILDGTDDLNAPGVYGPDYGAGIEWNPAYPDSGKDA